MLVSAGNFYYSFKDRYIHQYNPPEEEIACYNVPSFQEGFVSFIKNTDGGLMVAFSQGSIYYMNHAGEFFHLLTVSPPELGAILQSVIPPETIWKTKEGRVVVVNTDCRK